MQEKRYPSREFTDRDLAFSRFVVTYRPLIRKALFGLLIIIDIVLVLISIYGFSRHAIEYRAFNAQLLQFTNSGIDWNVLRPYITKPGLSVDEIEVLQNGAHTDFIARITNPNQNRYAHSFTYRFYWSGGETEWLSSFILPDETKHIIALGVPSAAATEVSLEIEKIDWRSISGEELSYIEDLTRGIDIIGGTIQQLGSAGVGLPLSAVSFQVKNNTPFTYLTSGFVIIISSASEYRAVTYETLLLLDAFETRDVDARFFQNLSTSGRTVIIEPDINFFDEENILL